MCQSEILSDAGSFRRARAAIRKVAGKCRYSRRGGEEGGGGFTYMGTGESVRKLTSVEQNPNRTTEIFHVFAPGRTRTLDGGHGGRLEPTFGPFASVGLFALLFQFPTAEREDGSKQKTRRGGSFCGEGEEAIDFPPIPPSIWRGRGRLRMLRRDDVICNRGPLVSVENCCRTQHVAARPPPSSPVRREINSGGIIQ